MKKLLVPVFGFVLVSGIISCADTKDRYVDLRTGKNIELVKDDKSGLMVDKNTKEPVYIYVDTKNNDTIYGKTGTVINGQVVKKNQDEYVYEKDFEAYEAKGDDYKVEV